jgi:hypothetical protein
MSHLLFKARLVHPPQPVRQAHLLDAAVEEPQEAAGETLLDCCVIVLVLVEYCHNRPVSKVHFLG